MSRLSPLTSREIAALPKPDVVETLSFEAILAELKADLVARWTARRAENPDLPELDAEALDVEGEPIVMLLEAAAFRETLLRGRINDAARARLLVFARGGDLEHIAGGLDLRRELVSAATDDAPAVYESDAALRRRILLAPSAFNTAGAAKAYVFYALTAAPSLADVSAVKAEPGQVVVTLLGAGQAQPSARELAAVRATMARDDLVPTTAFVTVQGPTVVQIDVEAELTLYPGPAKDTILALARSRLTEFLSVNRRLGADVARSALIARLHVEGVQSVALISPSVDAAASFGDVVVARSVSVTAPERGE